MRFSQFHRAIVALIFLSPVLGLSAAYLQVDSSKTDSLAVKADSTGPVKQPGQLQEFYLEPIRIEAALERPSVTLIPKRAETDVGDVPLTIRSFDKELKSNPENLSSYGEELETGKKIKKFNKKPKK